jgi:hypothetical protein
MRGERRHVQNISNKQAAWAGRDPTGPAGTTVQIIQVSADGASATLENASKQQTKQTIRPSVPVSIGTEEALAGEASLRQVYGLERFRAKHALGLDPGVGTGSREENASKQKTRASVPIQSERKRL